MLFSSFLFEANFKRNDKGNIEKVSLYQILKKLTTQSDKEYWYYSFFGANDGEHQMKDKNGKPVDLSQLTINFKNSFGYNTPGGIYTFPVAYTEKCISVMNWPGFPVDRLNYCAVMKITDKNVWTPKTFTKEMYQKKMTELIELLKKNKIDGVPRDYKQKLFYFLSNHIDKNVNIISDKISNLYRNKDNNYNETKKEILEYIQNFDAFDNEIIKKNISIIKDNIELYESLLTNKNITKYKNKFENIIDNAIYETQYKKFSFGNKKDCERTIQQLTNIKNKLEDDDINSEELSKIINDNKNMFFKIIFKLPLDIIKSEYNLMVCSDEKSLLSKQTENSNIILSHTKSIKKLEKDNNKLNTSIKNNDPKADKYKEKIEKNNVDIITSKKIIEKYTNENNRINDILKDKDKLEKIQTTTINKMLTNEKFGCFTNIQNEIKNKDLGTELEYNDIAYLYAIKKYKNEIRNMDKEEQKKFLLDKRIAIMNENYLAQFYFFVYSLFSATDDKSDEKLRYKRFYNFLCLYYKHDSALNVQKYNQRIFVFTSVFKQLGCTGIVDPGYGFIHTNEPAQAVFFGKPKFDSLETYYNDLSKSLERRVDNTTNVLDKELHSDSDYNTKVAFLNNSTRKILNILSELIKNNYSGWFKVHKNYLQNINNALQNLKNKKYQEHALTKDEFEQLNTKQPLPDTIIKKLDYLEDHLFDDIIHDYEEEEMQKQNKEYHEKMKKKIDKRRNN